MSSTPIREQASAWESLPRLDLDQTKPTSHDTWKEIPVSSRTRTRAGIKNIAIAGFASIVLAGALASCSDDASEAAPEPSAVQTAPNGDVFNGADVQFATDMIPHHAQAIAMVTMTDGRALDPDLARLATGIRENQAPEVETMVDWLTDWDQEIPETSLDHANAGHGMDGMSHMDGMDGMPGMMSAEEMTGLAEASDAAFQDMWIEMMIAHHTGAIEMARAEQDSGEFAAAVALAESIESEQQAEIEELESLLGS